MNTVSNKHPYILFYVNGEGKYEVMSFNYPSEIPEAFLKETSYVYSKYGNGIIGADTTPDWFKYVPFRINFYSSRFMLMDTKDVPGEVLALKLLIEDK